MFNAGRVSIVPKGEFVNGTQYERLDLVRYKGGIYVALSDNQDVLPDNQEKWMFLTEDSIRLSNLDLVDFFQRGDRILVGRDGENLSMDVENFLYPLLDKSISYNVRHMIPRGKNLGSVVTDEQIDRIGSSNEDAFRGFFLGDYWKIEDVVWRIVGFNYWYGIGDIGDGCVTPHLVIMPDHPIYGNAKMSENADYTVAYGGSDMRKTGLDPVKDMINNKFGEKNVLSHRIKLIESMTENGDEIGSSIWYDSTVEIPSLAMLFGHVKDEEIFSITDMNQLPGCIFETAYTFRALVWLRDRDFQHNYFFRGLYRNGQLATIPMYNTAWVRPVFGLAKNGGAM